MSKTIILENIRTAEQWIKTDFKALLLEGPDAKNYLNSQITSNIDKLASGEFIMASILEVSGKLTSTFLVAQRGDDQIIILVPHNFLTLTLERIEKFHIIEDFTVNELEEDVFLSWNFDSNLENEFRGQYILKNASFTLGKNQLFTKENEMVEDEFTSLRLLSGMPLMGVEVNSGDLINNTYFDELSVDYSKGCFPGQETVAKVHTRRGAAYKPVLLKTDQSLDLDKKQNSLLYDEEKKVGTLLNFAVVDGQTYIYASLLREYRIEGKQVSLSLNKELLIDGEVNYLPYLKVDNKDLAIELYDFAVDRFYDEDNEVAVEYFQKAIIADPLFEDAYESLGVLLGRLERFEDAIVLMKKLNELNPKSIMAYTNLSLYHMRIGEITLAEDYKSQATLKNFEILGDEAALKRKMEEVKKEEEAELERKEQMFLAVIDIDPEDSMANNGMGEVLLKRKNFESAIPYFKKAINGNKKYSVAYLGLSKAYYQLSEIDKLKSVLNEGIKIASKNGDLMPANEMQALLVKIN